MWVDCGRNERINELTYQRKNEHTNERTHERTCQRKNEHTNERTNEKTKNRQTDERMRISEFSISYRKCYLNSILEYALCSQRSRTWIPGSNANWRASVPIRNRKFTRGHARVLVKQYFVRMKACTGISVSTKQVRFSVEVLVWYDFKVGIGFFAAKSRIHWQRQPVRWPMQCIENTLKVLAPIFVISLWDYSMI